MLNLKGFRIEIAKLEKAKEAEDKRKRKEHKCNNCIWGTFISDKRVICSFSKCIKDKL